MYNTQKHNATEKNNPKQQLKTEMTLGKRLQYLMDMKKINQVDAAIECGLDRSRFNLLLNDKVQNPRRDTFQKISSFFDCDIEWLATGEGEPFPEEISSSLCLAMEEQQDDPYGFYGKREYGKDHEITETESKMVRTYRNLAEMDADTMGEIQTWLNDMEKIRPGFTGWFRLEFQNRFPEFDEWKNKVVIVKNKKLETNIDLEYLKSLTDEQLKRMGMIRVNVEKNKKTG